MSRSQVGWKAISFLGAADGDAGFARWRDAGDPLAAETDERRPQMRGEPAAPGAFAGVKASRRESLAQ